MLFDVTAKQSGNSVKLQVEADDIKAALKAALKEAKDVFDYSSAMLGTEEPTVSVKPSKEIVVEDN